MTLVPSECRAETSMHCPVSAAVEAAADDGGIELLSDY